MWIPALEAKGCAGIGLDRAQPAGCMLAAIDPRIRPGPRL